MMQIVEPRTRRWSRQEYYLMADAGLFDGQRVELIDGAIIEMSPHGSEHAMAIGLVQLALSAAFGRDYWVRVQLPLTLASGSEPEPDLAVVTGSPRDYPDHPSSAELVVEVADATWAHDSTRKANLYAAAGISDYWIVDLRGRRVRVLREPTADAAEAFGHRYADVEDLVPERTLSPLARPSATIRVADLLP